MYYPPPTVIGAGSYKLPVNLVRWPIKKIVRNGCPTLFATSNTLHSKLLHQPFDRTTSNTNTFSQQLPPYFASTINSKIVFPYPLHIKF
jgi:hypothetical protein